MAIAGLALEYARRAKNDTDKETRQQERLANMERQLSELELTLANQSAQMLQLERVLQHEVSPPTKSIKSTLSKLLPTVGSSPPAEDKKPTAQAFSVLDTSSFQSPLIQLRTVDYLVFPVMHAIQQTNDYIVSSLKKWSSLRWTNH